MAKPKISFVEETFILYHLDKMSVGEIATHLKGIGVKTIQKFLDSKLENEIEKDTPKKNKKKHTSTTKTDDKNAQNPLLPLSSKDKRATVMTQPASGHGDEVRENFRNKFNPSKVFIPKPTQKSF